ncbi:MAG: hypothetical protein GF421_03705 [Candidatus Aminicenantes bacterium]|nr:hypothetical protein [Candidatus Aminicenantes bacterium]
MSQKKIFNFMVLLVIGVFSALCYLQAADGPMDQQFFTCFQYRNLGPFRSGAWITDFAVPESPEKEHLYTFYVAGRNGGLWKTTNNGTTFESIFDDQDVFSIGDIALAPSNSNVLWVGTGEHTTSRSAYWGDGVYKSEDGGESWQHMGLKETHHIGRILIHPGNPDIVYVAAMGHLFSPNKDRGVFRTRDGGKSWEKVLYISDRVGVIDLVLNRKSPNVLYAAAYEKERFPWHFEAGGQKSGIFKTADSGDTWKKLTQGLPQGKIGRIGLDIYRSDPDILYAVVENLNLRPPTEQEAQRDQEQGREPQEREMGGEVYRSDDAGETWTKMNSVQDNVGGKAAYSFNQIRVDPNDDREVFVTSICLASSEDRGRTWHDINWPPQKMFSSAFGDVRTLWIDPDNSDRMMMGSDGGVFISYDGGKTCDFYDNLPMAQYYDICVDMEDPYNVYGGLQCHDSWKFPINSWSGEVSLEDMMPMGLGDGMYNAVSPEDSRWVYNTIQFGGHHRIDQKLGTRTNIQPQREPGRPPYRFNWCPPLEISPHNSDVIYAGTQVLLRSMHRGDDWQEISPDLTTNDAVKIAGKGHIQYCTITTISESPLTPGLIWVGTDDGKVWITDKSGADWNDRTENLVHAGAPEHYWVSRVFASHHREGRAYVSKTGFRRDDFRSFLFRTEDFGRTWNDISGNLPDKPINAVFEDHKNPDLLFVGNDKGVYVSIERGREWVYMRNNMPTIAVTDLLIHPRENDLVAATYGRGVFITDISSLQELSKDVLAKDVHLFSVEPAVQRETRSWGAYQLYGDRHFFTPNESETMNICYYLKDPAPDKVKIEIWDGFGNLLSELKGSESPGINTVKWDMRSVPTQEQKRRYGRWARGELQDPGEYLVVLEIGEKRFERTALIEKRTGWKIGPFPSDLR